jgi:hypothetical protein
MVSILLYRCNRCIVWIKNMDEKERINDEVARCGNRTRHMAYNQASLGLRNSTVKTFPRMI